MNEIGRRDALGLFLGAGAALALSACTTDSPNTEHAPPTTTSRPAPELENTARDLTLNLWAEPTTAEIKPGVTTDVFSFGAEVIDGDPASVTPSDSYLGPTLHMRTGQRVRITFENRLPEESIVHWHGLVVPQDQDGQPSDAVAPCATCEYDFIIDNPPGTYWYHPHPHPHGRTGEPANRSTETSQAYSSSMAKNHNSRPATTTSPSRCKTAPSAPTGNSATSTGQRVQIAVLLADPT